MRKREYLTLTIWLAALIGTAINGLVDQFIWTGILGCIVFSLVANTGIEHDVYLPPQHARPKGSERHPAGQRRGDSSPDEDGLHWGVMFQDGSVHHPWNGRTQRQRAHEHLLRILGENEEYASREVYPMRSRDNITLCVRRHGSTEWTRYVPSTDA